VVGTHCPVRTPREPKAEVGRSGGPSRVTRAVERAHPRHVMTKASPHGHRRSRPLPRRALLPPRGSTPPSPKSGRAVLPGRHGAVERAHLARRRSTRPRDGTPPRPRAEHALAPKPPPPGCERPPTRRAAPSRSRAPPLAAFPCRRPFSTLLPTATMGHCVSGPPRRHVEPTRLDNARKEAGTRPGVPASLISRNDRAAANARRAAPSSSRDRRSSRTSARSSRCR
jgi:hypothetical protein